MSAKCGLADGKNACRCRRQIPVAMAFGVIDLHRLQFADRTHPALRVVAEAGEIEAAASVLKAHPGYCAPLSVLVSIRALIDSGRYRVFDA